MSPKVRVRRRKDGTLVATGTLVFVWQRRGIGKIERATGLKDDAKGRRLFARLAPACDELYETSRLDIIEAIRDGILHPLKLIDAKRLNAVGKLRTHEYLIPLAEVFPAWVEGTENEETRRNRRSVWRTLERADKGATVGDLPALVGTVMAAMADRPAGANRVKEQAQAFIRDTLKKSHPIHQALGELKHLDARTSVRRRRRIHLTPEQLRDVLPKLGPAAEAFRLMCLTGMNPKEAWGAWAVEGAGVRIAGTKARDRKRVVPFLAPIARPTISRDVLVWHLNKHGLYPYAARHSYSRWLEDAGIPAWRVKVYLGHSAGSQTEHYQRGDMAQYLVGDGRLLCEFLSLPVPAPAVALSA